MTGGTFSGGTLFILEGSSGYSYLNFLKQRFVFEGSSKGTYNPESTVVTHTASSSWSQGLHRDSRISATHVVIYGSLGTMSTR